MIRSMTGFGRAGGKVGDRLSIAVLARSVNHRYLEVSVRLPEVLWEMEPAIRSMASATFQRGKLDITIRTERLRDPDYEVRLSRTIASRVLPELKELLSEFGIAANLTPSDLLRIPDLLQVVPKEDELDEGEQADVRRVVQEAFDALVAMRETEGVALRRDIEARVEQVRSGFASISTMRPAIQQEALQAYRQRVDELARAAGVTVDPDRVAQETVILVEKADVAEEIARAASHVAQIDALLGSPEPAGTKLDFLSQELLREVNTTGQKSRSADVRRAVVELKTAVERIREQVQNVE
ncbi:MAG TPA: YicC/YloC family endoribonuclease [Thermoanaerobaculia bacterium]|nr:YicC/YloC family endoribonuclease [Thermoanaerobaculia bacterium]